MSSVFQIIISYIDDFVQHILVNSFYYDSLQIYVFIAFFPFIIWTITIVKRLISIHS